MRNLTRIGSLLLAGAAMIGLAPRSYMAAKAQVQENTSQRNKQNAPMPTPAAKPGQLVSEQSLGGFDVRSANRWSPIWTGKPRGGRGAGFPFKRIKGQRWVGQ